MSPVAEIPLRVTRDRSLAEEWELVLIAEGLSPTVRSIREGFVLIVPADEKGKAVDALSAYESENPPRLLEEDQPTATGSVLVSFTAAAALLGFFFVTGGRNPEVGWFKWGSADAERILTGEFWRTVTALTLHSDLGHVLTNAIATALFLGALNHTLGPGLGCALFLLAGAGGNLLNAFLHGSSHISIGASTSVFGAIGVLGGLSVIRRRLRGMRGHRAWMPVAAAFALLALLGTGGQHVDLWAHLFGFLMGGALGILVALFLPRPPGVRAQWALGSATLIAVITCWTLAFR